MRDRCRTLPPADNRSGWPWTPPDDAGSPSDGATISIVLPSFNQGSYIEAAIRSVLLQNYERLELVVMDGGSTDGSVDVIRKYARHLTYWRSERDGGQSDAINQGLSQTTGSIFAWLNTDEIYRPGTLSTVAQLYARSEEKERFWLAGQCMSLDEHGAFVRTLAAAPPKNNPVAWLAKGWGLPTAATFWPRTALGECGLLRTDLHYAFDNEFCIRLLFAGFNPRLVPYIFGEEVLHEACKTVRYPERFAAEREHLPSVFADQLTADQLRQIAAYRSLRREIERLKNDGISYRALSKVFRLAIGDPARVLPWLINALRRGMGRSGRSDF